MLLPLPPRALLMGAVSVVCQGGCVEMVAPCLSDLKSIIGVNYR